MPKKLSRNSTENMQLTLFSGKDSTWRPVRDDFNFCRLAFFVAGDNKSDRFRDIRQEYVVEVNGKSFKALWEVRHDPELGLPGSFERDVWLGIMEIVQEQTDGGRKPLPEIIELGSTSEFLQRIGKVANGGNYKTFKEAIRRLAKTSCWSEKAFNCPSSGGYLQLFKNVSLMDAGAIKGEFDGAGQIHETTWIKLSEYVRKNLESGYIALLDLQYMRSLKGEFAKQLYPFLSYRFWLATQRGRDYVSIHWQELANYLAALGWSAPWRAKQRLQPSLNELIENGYIDATSAWQGEHFLFKFGDKFLDELQKRLNAKECYEQWIGGQKQVKQLRIIAAEPTPTPRNSDTKDGYREIVLIRQATRLMLGQAPDVQSLTGFGWTVEDAKSLAVTLKANQA